VFEGDARRPRQRPHRGAHPGPVEQPLHLVGGHGAVGSARLSVACRSGRHHPPGATLSQGNQHDEAAGVHGHVGLVGRRSVELEVGQHRLARVGAAVPGRSHQ
jgi:hypothetical protein